METYVAREYGKRTYRYTAVANGINIAGKITTIMNPLGDS
jgi:hypothetical protein